MANCFINTIEINVKRCINSISDKVLCHLIILYGISLLGSTSSFAIQCHLLATNARPYAGWHEMGKYCCKKEAKFDDSKYVEYKADYPRRECDYDEKSGFIYYLGIPHYELSKIVSMLDSGTISEMLEPTGVGCDGILTPGALETAAKCYEVAIKRCEDFKDKLQHDQCIGISAGYADVNCELFNDMSKMICLGIKASFDISISCDDLSLNVVKEWCKKDRYLISHSNDVVTEPKIDNDYLLQGYQLSMKGKGFHKRGNPNFKLGWIFGKMIKDENKGMKNSSRINGFDSAQKRDLVRALEEYNQKVIDKLVETKDSEPLKSISSRAMENGIKFLAHRTSSCQVLLSILKDGALTAPKVRGAHALYPSEDDQVFTAGLIKKNDDRGQNPIFYFKLKLLDNQPFVVNPLKQDYGRYRSELGSANNLSSQRRLNFVLKKMVESKHHDNEFVFLNSINLNFLDHIDVPSECYNEIRKDSDIWKKYQNLLR